MSQTQTTQDDEDSTAEDRLEEVEEEVEARIEDVESEVEDRIEEVEERVEEATERVEERVEDATERVEEATEDARENIEEALDDALATVDDNVVEVGSQVLDTTARADVYVALRSLDGGDAEEVAQQTGLYPDKVEDVLEALEDDGVVEESAGEYTAVAPTELVRVVSDIVTETVNDIVENGRDTIDDNRERLRDSRWSPFRLVDRDGEEADATEIPIEG